MNITYSTYVELPAPLSVVCDVLRAPATWSALPTGATRLGELWLWRSELYTVQFTADDPAGLSPGGATTGSDQPSRMRWTVGAVTGFGPRLRIDLSLYDAIISTHAAVSVVLTGGGLAWPWQHVRASRHIAAVVQECFAAIRVRLANHAASREPVAVLAGEQQESSVQAQPGNPDQPPTIDGLDPVASPAGSAGWYTPPASPQALADRLRARYPQTVTAFEEMGALDHLERVWGLEQGWKRILRGEYDSDLHRVVPMSAAGTDYDLIYAGGGLGLLHAATMAQCYGWRVLLFDRGDVGCVHREWNISRDELQALVDMGLVTWDELADVVMREYRNGVVRFYHSPASTVTPRELWMPGVLSVAIDAGALLRLMRRKLEAAGGTVLDRRVFKQVRASADDPLRVEVELEARDSRWNGAPTREAYSARLLLDGMGTTSPLAQLRHAGRPFAGVCPTVGTVAGGFVEGAQPDEHDPTIGDILVSVADTQNEHQLIWEGFPGRGDELTVYVFYYVTLNDRWRPVSPDESFSLFDLFEQYFTLLPSYKKPGPDFRHIKPVYGYIPGRHSLRRQEAPLLRGVLPVGDAAAQQSPLTFCGFGSHVRNLHRTTSLLDYALRRNLLVPGHLSQINAFQTNVSLHWVFSRFMHPWGRPHDVNELQNVFLATLNELGIAFATRFFQDRMLWADYGKIVRTVLRRYPEILVVTWRALGPWNIYRWVCDYLRFSFVAAQAAVGGALSPHGERAIYALLDRLAPAVSLRVRSLYAEWRAMGWVSG